MFEKEADFRNTHLQQKNTFLQTYSEVLSTLRRLPTASTARCRSTARPNSRTSPTD